MNETATTSAEPAYTARLALTAAPFSSENQIDFFFNGRRIEQRLNLLRHLLRATDKIALLQADSGMGKSTLLTQLIKQSSKALLFCRVDGRSCVDAESLRYTLLKALGTEVEDINYQTNNADDFLQKRLLQLRSINRIPVLMIDNAHALPAALWDALSNWLKWQSDQQFLLQAVMATEIGFTLPLVDEQGRVLVIDIPPLEADKIGDYLLQRLQSVGFIGEQLFTDKQLKNFYQQSAGNPEALNRLAHQQLLGINPASKLSLLAQLSLHSPRAALRWAGVIMVLIIVAILLSYQQQINDWLTVGGKDNEVEQTIQLPPEDKLATVVVGEDKEVSAEQGERNELKSLLAALPRENGAATPSTSVTESASAESKAVAPAVKKEKPVTSAPAVKKAKVVTDAPAVKKVKAVTDAPVVKKAKAVTSAPVVKKAKAVTSAPAVKKAKAVAPAPAVKKAKAVAPAPAVKKAKAVADAPEVKKAKAVTDAPAVKKAKAVTSAPVVKKAKVAASVKGNVHQKSWIMQQKSTAYTFQLMGSWEPQKIDEFIKKHAFTGDIARFESMRYGRVWHTLIYGVYANKQAAIKASAHWAAPLKSLPSWLRRFGSVQKQITEKAPKP